MLNILLLTRNSFADKRFDKKKKGKNTKNKKKKRKIVENSCGYNYIIRLRSNKSSERYYISKYK
jgi:hypothetical protein